MSVQQRAQIRSAKRASALVAALLMSACGGGSDSSTPVFVPVNVSPPQTITEQPAPAPFAAPAPLADVGPQFDNSPTGTPYPKLATLYPGHDGPTVNDGMILPWLSPKRAPLKFTVMVQTTRDTDGDGKPDRMALRIVQPAEVADGLKTPVIVRPSPYYGNPNYPDYETKSRGPFLGEDQYLRMGFSIVYSDSLGTNQSQGCASIMDGSERDASAAVVRWLANDAATQGFDAQGVAVRAAWSTGHVAMEGVSYGGTTPTMTAATGVTGLEAIVPVDGISSAYDYFARYDGVVPDEDNSTALAPYVTSLTPAARKNLCEANRLKLAADADDVTLAYNAFWKERNTLLLADKIKAATLIAHGQSDNNVKAKNSVQLYDTLYRMQKPVQLWFHSRDHDDPAWQKEWQKQILLWYTRYLFGVNNGVEKQPTYVRETPAGDKIAGDIVSPPDGNTGDTVVGHCGSGHSPRDCIPTGELLVKEDAWPTTSKVAYSLRGNGTGLLLTPLPTDGTALAPIAFKATSNSGTFETRPIANATRFAGSIKLSMTARFKVKVANLKAYLLVDGKQVTWGWANPRFYKSIEKPETIALDTDYKLSLEMMPRDFTVLPGSKIALRIQGYNGDSSSTTQQIVLDASQTTLEMPLVPKASAAAVMKLGD